MIKVENKKTEEILASLNTELNKYQIRYGSPDARYKLGYYLYKIMDNGYGKTNLYGEIIMHNLTLKGLINNINQMMKQSSKGA